MSIAEDSAVRLILEAFLIVEQNPKTYHSFLTRYVEQVIGSWEEGLCGGFGDPGWDAFHFPVPAATVLICYGTNSQSNFFTKTTHMFH